MPSSNDEIKTYTIEVIVKVARMERYDTSAVLTSEAKATYEADELNLGLGKMVSAVRADAVRQIDAMTARNAISAAAGLED